MPVVLNDRPHRGTRPERDSMRPVVPRRPKLDKRSALSARQRRHRTRHPRRTRPPAILIGVVTMVLATLAAPAAQAAPGPRPDFQLPFPCGEQWRLDSYSSSHAPALDVVREPDQAGTEGALLIAPADGTVVYSDRHENAGNTIQINHGGGWFTTYLHLQARSVANGQRVSQGQAIGRVGKDGATSNGTPHLHYELAI